MLFYLYKQVLDFFYDSLDLTGHWNFNTTWHSMLKTLHTLYMLTVMMWIHHRSQEKAHECRALHRKLKHRKERQLISNYYLAKWGRRGAIGEEAVVVDGGQKSVECWWTFEHFYMPEGIPLTTLIKVIIGAIGACQMPSLPSQLPRSPWTQLLTSSWRRGGNVGEASLEHM